MLDALGDGQALFFRALSDRLGATSAGSASASSGATWSGSPAAGSTWSGGGPGGLSDEDLAAAVWDLVWAGWLTNDTLAPLRTLLGSGGGAHRAKPAAPRTRYRRPGRVALPSRTGPPTVAGRWSRLPDRDTDPTRRAAAAADALLERHGVVTRGAVAAEGVPGGFAAVYPVLAALEERGAARRGYFVEGLGAAQFAVPGAVDRLRALADDHRRSPSALVLAATDPANPFGAALPWPERVVAQEGTGHRPGRKAGALVVLVAGTLTLYVERGGRTLLSFVDEDETLATAAKALADAVHTGALGALSVERADGEAVFTSPLRDALTAAGFRATPKGLRLRG
uniref:Lhr family helicase n=1 Tax=Phytohabitans suffuscus TaxID=624315 RepID=UPI001E2E9443